MFKRKTILAITGLVTTFAAASSNAASPVTVNFKNVSTTTAATYYIVSTNEQNTYNAATPKPMTTVPFASTDTYVVLQPANQTTANFASVRYKMGSKECAFYTVWIAGSSGNPGSRTASNTPSGGATCTSTITSVNASTNAWTVEFTMK